MAITSDNIEARLSGFTKVLEKELKQQISLQLGYLGQECVKMAREIGTYTDRTGNLRSSIGAVMQADGNKVMETPFNQVSAGGSQGSSAGRTLANETLAEHRDSPFSLVVVAGMDYASYVEDIHNLDVLSSAERYAKGEYMNRIKDAAEATIERMNKMQI